MKIVRYSFSLEIASTACLVCVLALSTGAAEFIRPAGIYSLGSGANAPMPRLGGIRNVPFVDGYAWRVGWTDFETGSGVYDFSGIDAVVAALEPIGQKLSIGMHSGKVPDYILALPGVTTYAMLGSTGETITVVPWDDSALCRWEAFYQALADHQLPDASQGGAMIAFRDHPTLEVVRAQIVGMGAGIRDRGNRLTAVPSFDRNVFTTAALRSIHASMDQFPGKFHDLPFFPDMNDGNSAPTILAHLLDTFRAEFDGVLNQRLGLFEENLACATPTTQFAWPLFQEQDSTFIMFQMVQAWQVPFSNPDNTNVCLSATQGPDIGIAYGFNTFNARYFEVYTADLDFAGFADSLQVWHDILSTPTPPINCCDTPGDFNHDASFNIADVTSSITRIFSGGPAPLCQDEADANGDNSFNIADVTYAIARIFSGGPAPICGTTGT